MKYESNTRYGISTICVDSHISIHIKASTFELVLSRSKNISDLKDLNRFKSSVDYLNDI